MTDAAFPATRCRAVVVLADGHPAPCQKRRTKRSPYCGEHTGPLRPDDPRAVPGSFDEWVATAKHAIERRLRGEGPARGEHDPEVVKALIPLALPLYEKYWRVEVLGVENIPASGPGLLVANHSGTIPIDGAMLKLAVLKEFGRNPWLLAADLALSIPGFADLVRMTGNARADRDETLALMRRGELLGVFPEGFKGIGKGWSKRYQLQRFGRGGFVEVSMETGAPIIPVAIIGAEETYPMVGNLRFLARRLKLPYFPVTPTWPLLGPLGALPLPAKWIIAFGEPIPMVQYGEKATRDTQLVLELTEEVRGAVQRLIFETLPKRRTTFL